MTFDGLPGFTTTGKVMTIDSLGTVTQGVVTYNVTIGFDHIDPKIKPGMSVTANIITATQTDVLMVPLGSVKTGSDGQSYVTVLKNGQPQEVSVQTGTSNNTDIVITSGLSAGDEVVTQTITAGTAATTTATPGGGGFGGGRGGFRIGG
jgi:HlyD family secretion protein